MVTSITPRLASRRSCESRGRRWKPGSRNARNWKPSKICAPSTSRRVSSSDSLTFSWVSTMETSMLLLLGLFRVLLDELFHSVTNERNSVLGTVHGEDLEFPAALFVVCDEEVFDLLDGILLDILHCTIGLRSV